MTDSLLRFHFPVLSIRGELVRLPQTLQAALDRHDYPAPVRQLLGQALAAVALMTSTLKLEGSLVLQVQGDGPVRLLMAECNDQGDLRAIARYDEDRDWSQVTAWASAVGQGQCVLTIDPVQGERYQGIVSLTGDSLADVLGHYFQQSEQLPTRFWLQGGADAAAGLLLQVLPADAQATAVGDDWTRLVALADTLTADELLHLPGTQLLYRLYHEDEVVLLGERALRFRCSCSRERSANALRSIDRAELMALADEQGGRLEVDCQFCHQRYVFDAVDLAALHGDSAGSATAH